MLSMSDTVKLLQSSFSTNEFGTSTRALKKSGIFRMLQGASQQLPLAFYSCIFLLVIFVAVMISGAIIYATAENEEINQITKYNDQISTYQEGGLPLLQKSNFSFVFNTSTNDLVDPIYQVDPVQLIGDEYPLPHFTNELITHGDANNYDRLQYALRAPFFLDIPFPQPPFDQQIPSVAAQIYASLDNSASIFLTPELLLYKSITTMMSMKDGQSDCENDGGYYNEDQHSCTTFAVLSTICMTVQDTTAWWLQNTNGCYYPFDGLGVYESVVYNASTPMSFGNVSLEIRSYDDPAVYLEDITDGHNSFDYNTKHQKRKGSDIMAIACVPLLIAVGICAILYHTQARWKLADIATVNLLKSGGAAFRIVEKKTSVVTVFGILSALSFGMLGIGLSMLGHWSMQEVMEIQGYLPIQVVVFFMPISFITLSLFLSSLSSSSWTYQKKVATLLCASLWCFGVCLFSIFYLIRPNEPTGAEKDNADMLSMFFGTAICFAFGPYAIVCLFLAWSQRKPQRSRISESCERNSYGTDLEPLLEAASNRITDERHQTRMTIYYLVCLFVVIPFIFFFVTMLPPIWNVYYSVYDTFDSPYSLMHMAPEGDKHTNFKLYEDVVLYYSYFYALVMCGMLLTFKPIRKVFHKSIVLGRFASSSVGEIFFITSWLMVFCYWVYFWAFKYDRIAGYEPWERSSRVLGHVCNFLMSCLVYPVSRNSIWDYLFGIPFEKAIKYHRWLGYMTVGAFTLHMLSWYGYYLDHNISILGNLFNLQNDYHPDNWTISTIIWGAWFPSVLMLITALDYFRRKYFEVFYYVHHLYILIFIYALIHSWSLWYFLAPGLTLYFFDRLIRFVRGSFAADVVSIAYGFGGNVRIEFRPPPNFSWKAGQYVFLNVPAVSLFQWHPFSISVSPYSENIVLCLKGNSYCTLQLTGTDMGCETFTNKLARLALSPWAGTTSLKVDGPYGNSFNYSEGQIFVLVAGGIGVTPMHSVLSDIYQTCLSQPDKTSHIQKVYFFWSVREFPILELFKDSLVRIQNFNLNGRFEINLSCTSMHADDHNINSESQQDTSNARTLNSSFDDTNLAVSHGRFDFEKVLSEIAASSNVPSNQIVCHACGPTQMVDNVAQLAHKLGFEMQTETFEL